MSFYVTQKHSRGSGTMFIERRISVTTGSVDLWECKWDNSVIPAHKVYVRKIGPEHEATPPAEFYEGKSTAICWSYGRTLGNIAVFTDTILGNFPAGSVTMLNCLAQSLMLENLGMVRIDGGVQLIRRIGVIKQIKGSTKSLI